MHSDRSYRICIYDPGHFTPYYNAGLCRQFASMGLPCSLITSPATFEPVAAKGDYDVSFLFFPFLQGPLGPMLRHRPGLRRILKAFAYPIGVWRTYRTLKRQPAGVFHIHFPVSPVLDTMLARSLHRREWHIVYTLQEPHPEGVWNRWQYGRLMDSCDVIVMHSENLAARLRELFPEHEPKIAALTHGTDLPEVPAEQDREQARSWLGVSREQPLLLFFGMIKPYKGLEDLLAALPAVLQCTPGVRLCIAGEPLTDMRGVLEKIAKLPDQTVISRIGFVPQSEVGRYFAAADLVVAPYREVAASAVVLQAQSYGRPVLATRVGALPQLLGDGSCGFLAGDDLAEAIIDALSDRERLAELGRRGRERVETLHSWEHAAKETLKLYGAKATAKPDPRL